MFRIMLRMRIKPGLAAEFEQVWLDSGAVITDQPANLGQSLSQGEIDEATGETVYYIISDWVDEQRFREYERSKAHLEHRAHLHPYRAGGDMATMRVVHAMAGAGA